MTMTIDLHTHYVSPALADALRKRTVPPRIETLPDGSERFHLPVGFLQFGSDYIDMEARLRFMDGLGIAKQLLSFPGLFGVDSLAIDEAEPLLLPFNDDLATLCRRYPDRFAGLAALPFADMDRAVTEYRRTRTELGLVGAILPVNGFLSIAEAEKFKPILDAARDLGGHLFIHPGRRPDQVPADPGKAPPFPFPDTMLLRQALGIQNDVAQCMATLLFSDVLNPYPNVSIHVANLGGTLPMVVERMDHVIRLRTDNEPLPSQRLRRVYVDCSSLGPRSIEIAVSMYGADRIVFGTDCPIFRTDWSLEAVQAAAISDEDRAKILYRNAKALLAAAS
jgi:predicted TIM-barrel fold metal-dependent hydrolase